MRLAVDSYLVRRFDRATQNCWHVARDAWLELTGVDLGDRTPAELTARALIARFDSDVPAFKRLPGPTDPCLVLMRRAGVVPHVGVYYRRRVLQMQVRGPSYVPLADACRGFGPPEFYR